MSILSSLTYLGGMPAFGAELVTVIDPQEKAAPGEPINRESIVVAAPWGGDGFGKAPPWSFPVAWAMRRYSACVLAYAVTAGPVFAGSRTATIRNADDAGTNPTVPTGAGVQVTQSPEEKRRKLTEDVFEDQWPDILNGLESYNFGHWLQEVIWGRAYGVTAPVRFKSTLPWEIQLQRDKFNDFAGFKLYGTSDSVRDARYAFHAVCQPQFDPIFGVARSENAREAWYRAVKSHENGDKIEKKASGIQMMLELPTGSTFSDSDGNPVLTREMVQTIVNAAAAGATFTIPIPWKKSDIQANPKLAEIPLIRVKEFDWGDTGPSLLAAISRLDRLDKEIFRAWNRPEREAMEGTHGTKAEAGVHGQVGITDSEKVHADFLRQFNKQVVDRFLTTNFGPDAAGSIYFKPAPLADPQQTFKQDVAKALLASPVEGPAVAANVDKRRLLKDTELPLVPEDQVVVPVPDMTGVEPGDQVDEGDDLGLSADRRDGDGDGFVTGAGGKDDEPALGTGKKSVGVFVVDNAPPERGESFPAQKLWHTGDMIRGKLGEYPITASIRTTIDKVTKKTASGLSDAVSDPAVADILKRADVSNFRVEPSNYKGNVGWTMAHSRGEILFNPRTQENLNARNKRNGTSRTLKAVVSHEAGHSLWDHTSDNRKSTFAAALNASPEYGAAMDKKIGTKATGERFDSDAVAYRVSEIHAETQAMRVYDSEAYAKVPQAIRVAAEEIYDSATPIPSHLKSLSRPKWQ